MRSRPSSSLIACPVCESTTAITFFELHDVPVNSVKLMRSRKDAESITRGQIQLKRCVDCGMIWNAAFDGTLVHYDADYEETQSFSPTFRSFQTELAKNLVKRFDLLGKTVLEIGCGKGEFLEDLLGQGVGKGIGFDPGFDQRRVQGKAAYASANIEIINDFFPPKHGPLPKADFYVCKMTLEHIPFPLPLLKRIRDAMPNSATLCIIVPSTERILAELAYWDIYYEHCNYFSIASLQALLTLSGFKTLETHTLFDDQYIQIIGQADWPRVKDQKNPDPNRPEPMSLHSFSKCVQLQWQHFHRALVNQRTLIWGAASKAVALLHALPDLQDKTTLTDINPHKHNTYLPGTSLLIHDPNALRGKRFDTIMVANSIYTQEITDQLIDLDIGGVIREIDTFSA